MWPHGLWDLDMIDCRDFVSLGTSFDLSRPYLRSELDGMCLITSFVLNCTAIIKCLLRTLCRFLTSVRSMSPHFYGWGHMIIELEFGPRSADSEASILSSKTSSRSGQVFLWGLCWGQRLRTRLRVLQAYLFFHTQSFLWTNILEL